MTATDAPGWLDLGPAEFDISQMPGGRRRREFWRDGQGQLFFMAVPPKGAKVTKFEPEFPGQTDIFDALADEAS